MNVSKPFLVRTFAGVLLALSFGMTANAQEVKIGVVNVPVLMEQGSTGAGSDGGTRRRIPTSPA